MKTTKNTKKKSIRKTRGRKYRNKNNNKNTRNIIGGGIDTLDKLILNNIRNNQFEDMNELKDTYQNVMFKNDRVPEVVRNSKLESIQLHIEKYIKHYTIALDALNEIKNNYKFLDKLFEELNKLINEPDSCELIEPYKNYILEIAKDGSFSINKDHDKNELIHKIISNIYIDKDSSEFERDSFVSEFERVFKVPYEVIQKFRVLYDNLLKKCDKIKER